MASEGGGKIKSKRGHSSSKPYERRKSLFRRITDSIKDVLRPSWLPGDTSDDPITSEDPGTASSDDQFLNPVPPPTQLGGKQGHGLMTNEPRLYPQLPQPDHPDVPVNTTIPWQQGPTEWQRQGLAGRSTWGSNSAPFDKAQFCKDYFAQKHAANTKQTDAAPEIPPSPRGLGGPAPPVVSSPATSAVTGRRRLVLPGSGISSPASGQLQNDSLASSLAAPGLSSSSPECSEENPSKRQRLWSPNASRKGRSLQPAVKDRPAFKISVFSSPSLNESLHESPFYSGKTTYGGASAYRRQSLNSSLPYQNSLPLRKAVKAKPLNNSGNAVLSSSATQILKTLERLSDAKRSRANETETESLLSFTPSSYRKPSRPLQTSLPSRSLELPVRGPPTRQLNTAVAASIARNRQIVSLPARQPPPRTNTVTRSQQDDGEQEGASDSDDVQVVDIQREKRKSKHNLQKDVEKQQQTQAASTVASEGTVSKASGKMKHAKSYDTRQKASREEDEVVEIPNLRTDFTLPINSMPGFNLGLAATAPLPSASKSSLPSSTLFSSPTSVAAPKGTSLLSSQSPPKLQFTFSSPIQKSGPGSSGSSTVHTQDFRFSSPLKVTQSVSASNDKPAVGATTSSSMTSFSPSNWGSTAPKPKASVTENAQSSPVGGNLGRNNETSSAGVASLSASGGPFKPAAQLKSGSVMDILGSAKKSEASSFGSGSGLQPAAQLKHGSVMDILGGKSSSQSESTGGDSLFAKFVAPAGSWDCDTCMLQNKPGATKCMACETPKPGAKKNADSAPPPVTSGDSLFAKFAAPVGSWECEACMLQNKPDATKCVACETPKRGTAPAKAPPSDDLLAKFRMPAGGWECDMCMVQNAAAQTKCQACETPKPGAQATAPASDDLMAKFRMPTGAWECDVCMVQNTATQTKCLACETPKPGTQATGSAPSAAVSFMPPSTSSSAPCPFLSAVSSSSSQQSVPTAGFKFVPTASNTSSGGFQFGSNSSGVTGPSGNGGFKLGNQDTSNSNSASSPATGFKFGAKDSSDSNGTSATKESGFKFGADAAAKTAVSVPATFNFGSTPASSAPSSTGGFVFGGPSGTSPGQTMTSTPSSVASAGFSFGSSTAGSGGIVFGSSAAQSQSMDSTAKGVEKLTSSAPSDSGKEGAVSSSTFAPVFGTAKPSNTFALGAAPSLAASGGSMNTLTSGGFQLGASTASSGPSSVFGASLTSKVTLPGGDASKSESDSTSSKLPSMPGGFSFGAAAKTNNDTVAKPGLFASALGDSSSRNGPSVAPGSSTSPQGFGFSAPGALSTTASSSLFSAAPQLSTGGFGSGGAAPVKPVVNGEVGAPSLFSFGQQSTAGSSTTGGFSFGATTNAKETGKQSFVFGADSSAKPPNEKRHLDNDSGQGEAKKRSFSLSGAPSTGDSESFKFGSTASTAGNNNLFKFGSTTEGPVDKAPSNTMFGGQASGFGGAGTQGGFSFSNPQTNAASSTGAPTPQGASVFGAGAGSTNSGLFSMGTGAAASSFGSGAPASQGFNFGGSVQPSFNLPAPVFNFAAPSNADQAPAQPAPGVFVFGGGPPSADTNSQPTSFTAPAMGSFAATPAQNNFNVGTGEGSRRVVKRAVRRTTVRK